MSIWCQDVIGKIAKLIQLMVNIHVPIRIHMPKTPAIHGRCVAEQAPYVHQDQTVA